MIDVVILNYNDADTVIEQLNYIKTYKNINKVLIVDNMSTDNSFTKLKEYVNDKILLISSEKNGGYGYGNNIGIKYLVEHYNSKYILLANPDVIYTENTLNKLKNFLDKNEDFVIVAPFMLDSQKNKQYNTAFRIPSKIEYIMSLGFISQKIIKSFYYKNIINDKSAFMQVGGVAGSLFLMNANIMIKYGMYDEKMFLYCEEIVLGLKMKQANYKIGILLQETFIHNHSVSINKNIESKIEKRKILIDSKLYVIRNWYRANIVEYLIALFMGKISLLEYKIICFFKRE